MNRFRERKKKKADQYFDYSLLFIVLFLLGFGMIMIYSTSSYEASKDYGDAAYYLKKQAVSTTLGIAAMIVTANIPYHFWEKFAVPGYIISAVLICLVLTPIGVKVKGARRWLDFGIGFRLQPAEIAKLCMILFLASMVCKMGKGIRTGKGFATVLLVPLPISLMIWKITDNMSSAIIVFGIAALMLFVSSPDYKKFILLGLAGSGAIAALIYIIVHMASSENLGFRGERILAWLDPEAYPQDGGYQVLQGLYAIGSGGLVGKGLGESIQKMGFVPEAQNDMIFSIVCEELGLIGATIIMLLFAALILRGYWIALHARDRFGSLLVIGVTTLIAMQTFLNIGVVTGLLPTTGISLPFFSYGGTALSIQLAEMGVVLSVSRQMKPTRAG